MRKHCRLPFFITFAKSNGINPQRPVQTCRLDYELLTIKTNSRL